MYEVEANCKGDKSPLAEGRELKFVPIFSSAEEAVGRPSRRGVN